MGLDIHDAYFWIRRCLRARLLKPQRLLVRREDAQRIWRRVRMDIYNWASDACLQSLGQLSVNLSPLVTRFNHSL